MRPKLFSQQDKIKTFLFFNKTVKNRREYEYIKFIFIIRYLSMAFKL